VEGLGGSKRVSVQASSSNCAAQEGFSPNKAASGLRAADELARTGGVDTAVSAGKPPPAARQAAAPDQAPLTLLQLPAEVLVIVFSRLEPLSLERLAATCSEIYYSKSRPMTPLEEALRQRAAEQGCGCPAHLPHEFSSWAVYLALLEHHRDEACAPVAAGCAISFFVAEGGRLMSCGAEGEEDQGMLGHGELEGEDRLVPTPTLLQSMAGIRISSVAAGGRFSAAVSATATVYTWGYGSDGCLGHGDEEGLPVPKQVQVLAGHRVLSACAGQAHCLAVSERGEVFSWGWDEFGQWAMGSPAASS
jgi:hypothetical protein